MTDEACEKSRTPTRVLLVEQRLTAIWPEEMARMTGAGVSWGHLVAVAAVSALDER